MGKVQLFRAILAMAYQRASFSMFVLWKAYYVCRAVRMLTVMLCISSSSSSSKMADRLKFDVIRAAVHGIFERMLRMAGLRRRL